MLEIALKAFSAGIAGLKYVDSKRSGGKEALEERREAIAAVRAAAIKTRAFLYDKEVGNNPDRDAERAISEAWLIASSRIEAFNEELFEKTYAKSLGYADPREWKKISEAEIDVSIDSIVDQCDRMLEELRK